MARGIKTGGRKAGTPNKRTAEVADRLESLGCDPIEGLARIAMDESNSVEIRLRAYSELAPYVAAKRKAMDLSGGFRRRIQVAKAMLVNTPVVFLDEFSTGMDPILKRSVMELLREEARRGRTIVLTTQILSEAEALCDDILIINHGREVVRGDVETIKKLSTQHNASLEDVFVELMQAGPEERP